MSAVNAALGGKPERKFVAATTRHMATCVSFDIHAAKQKLVLLLRAGANAHVSSLVYDLIRVNV